MKNSILLLEDDISLNETICEYLEELDYKVISCFNGEEALELIYENSFDLYLLDVNVPFKNGFEVLKQLRNDGNTTPAIYMTSLNSMESLEKGYDSGCDDYIRKPFELKELSLRIQTILKREYSKTNVVKICENINFNVVSNILLKDEVEVKLNNKELKLLKFFLKNPNELLNHERIYEYVWDYDEQFSDSSLRTYIKNLRKILGKDKIVSLKKLGYRFNQE